MDFRFTEFSEVASALLSLHTGHVDQLKAGLLRSPAFVSGKGVNRWIRHFDVDVDVEVVEVAAADAVTALTTTGVAGVVDAVAAAAVDRSHASRATPARLRSSIYLRRPRLMRLRESRLRRARRRCRD